MEVGNVAIQINMNQNVFLIVKMVMYQVEMDKLCVQKVVNGPITKQYVQVS